MLKNSAVLVPAARRAGRRAQTLTQHPQPGNKGLANRPLSVCSTLRTRRRLPRRPPERRPPEEGPGANRRERFGRRIVHFEQRGKPHQWKPDRRREGSACRGFRFAGAIGRSGKVIRALMTTNSPPSPHREAGRRVALSSGRFP